MVCVKANSSAMKNMFKAKTLRFFILRKYLVFLIYLLILSFQGNAQFNYSVDFDGYDDYIDLGTMDINPSQMTISAWIKADRFDNNQEIISKATGTGYRDYFWMIGFQKRIISNNEAFPVFKLKAGATKQIVSYSSRVYSGTWYHIAATYDGNTMKLYLNGTMIGSTNVSGNIQTNSNVPAWIGANPSGSNTNNFDGHIDEIRIWNKALSQSEIRERMFGAVENTDILWNNLVNYWNVDYGMGQVLNDEKDNQDGVFGSSSYPDQNDPVWTSLNYFTGFSTVGNALDFDGEDDYVNLGKINISGNHMTLSAWFKADNFDFIEQRIISKSGVFELGTTWGGFFGWLVYPKVSFKIGNVVLETGPSTDLIGGKWYHVAATYDGSAMKIYLNGEQVATRNYNGGIPPINNEVWVGNDASATNGFYAFNGAIDNVSIWQTSLSLTEIQNIMYDSIDANHPQWNNLISAYRFDEGSGQIVYDFKGSNHGTLGKTGNAHSDDPWWMPPGSPSNIIWDGETSEDAQEANNWSNDVIPVNSDVEIPPTQNDPVITQDMQLGNVKIEAQATVKIPVGKTLTINGDLTLKADATGTAGIDIEGDVVITGTTKIEKYQHKEKHHYVATPVDSQNVNLFSDAPKFKNWDPNVKQWDANISGNFELVRGYVVKYSENTIKQFKGNMNLGYSYYYNVSSSNYGWNLVGNPYPFVIDADNLITYNNNGSNPLITGTLWFWAEGDDYYSTDYSTYTPVTGGVAGYQGGPVPNNKIAPGQGFFVQALRNGAFEVNKDMKTTGDALFYNAERTVQRAWFNLVNKNMNYGDYNELLISFFDGASKGRDKIFDGKKNKGNWYISFYSIIGNEDFATQALPPISEVGEMLVPIGYDIKIPGDYTISIKSLERIADNIQIFLEDKETGTFVDLREDSYTFYSGRASVKDRFLIHFLPSYTVTDPQMNEDNQTVANNDVVELESNQLEENTALDQLNVYSSGKDIYVITSGDFAVPGEVKLFDVTGKEVFSDEVNIGFYKKTLNFEAGYYILTYKSSISAMSKKVFLE